MQRKTSKVTKSTKFKPFKVLRRSMRIAAQGWVEQPCQYKYLARLPSELRHQIITNMIRDMMNQPGEDPKKSVEGLKKLLTAMITAAGAQPLYDDMVYATQSMAKCWIREYDALSSRLYATRMEFVKKLPSTPFSMEDWDEFLGMLSFQQLKDFSAKFDEHCARLDPLRDACERARNMASVLTDLRVFDLRDAARNVGLDPELERRKGGRWL